VPASSVPDRIVPRDSDGRAPRMAEERFTSDRMVKDCFEKLYAEAPAAAS
jgi:hypothetical protein